MDNFEFVKQTLNLIDVVEEDVNLKKSGKVLKGLCPFHEEKTPSFTVYPTGDWHCFGCHKGGTVIDYIMNKIGTNSASEALMYIANKYNIKLKNYDKKAFEKRKQIIQQKRKEAADYYKQFHKANEFVKQRKISREIFDRFGIGFDPDRKGIAIPFLNTYGEVVGISYRLFDENGPKYINESETELFQKSKLLYGLDKARKHMKEKVYIVEGYFDVLALHEMGIQSAVAYCGSFITDDQINLLKSYLTEDTKIYLIPDNDPSGLKSAQKNIEKIRRLKNRLSIIELPKGIKDTNDLLIAGKKIQDIKPTHVLMYLLKTELDKCLERIDEYEVAYEFGHKTKNEMLKQEMVRYLSKRWNESPELVSRHMSSKVPQESLIHNIHGFMETFIDYQKEVLDEDKNVIRSCYPELDRFIPRNFRKKDLVYIMGRSGSGKTTFAINLAYNAIQHQNKRIGFFSIELPKEAIIPQFIQIHKNWPEKLAERFAREEEEFDDELKYLMSKFEEHIAIVDKEGITLEDIERYVHVMNEEFFNKPVDAIFIDYFGMIKRPGRKDDYHELSEQARNLKEMAKRLDCTVFCLVQANRAGGKDGSEPLTLESSRDTGAIEESADYVIGLYRPGLSPKIDPEERVLVEKKMQVQMLKARWGMTGECTLRFDGKTKKITDWDDRHI